MATIREVRRVLVAASRRHARLRDEAEDIAHDIIVAALRRGLALEDDRFTRSAAASARRQGAFVARSAARRRACELLCVPQPAEPDREELNVSEAEPPAPLPSALQTTLLLLSLGHSKLELRAALGLTDAALRKRLQGLRQRGPLARPQFTGRSAGSGELRRTQVGVLPQLASRLEGPRGGGRLIAVGDCEGHGLIFAEVLTNGMGTATSSASAPRSPGSEALMKEKPC